MSYIFLTTLNDDNTELQSGCWTRRMWNSPPLTNTSINTKERGSRTRPEPLGGSLKRRKLPASQEDPSPAGRSARTERELQRLSEHNTSLWQVELRDLHSHATALHIRAWDMHLLVQVATGCWNWGWEDRPREDCCWPCEDSLKRLECGMSANGSLGGNSTWLP